MTETIILSNPLKYTGDFILYFDENNYLLTRVSPVVSSSDGTYKLEGVLANVGIDDAKIIAQSLHNYYKQKRPLGLETAQTPTLPKFIIEENTKGGMRYIFTKKEELILKVNFISNLLLPNSKNALTGVYFSKITGLPLFFEIELISKKEFNQKIKYIINLAKKWYMQVLYFNEKDFLKRNKKAGYTEPFPDYNQEVKGLKIMSIGNGFIAIYRKKYKYFPSIDKMKYFLANTWKIEKKYLENGYITDYLNKV